jgi:hypothetical protein
MAAADLTAARLREVLHYGPETGVFTWRVTLSRRAKAGKAAGSTDKVTGYVRIRIDKRIHQAHRLAWLYMTGDWPAFDIDHKDTVRGNNAWTNLRDVPHAINGQNQRRAHARNRSSGLLGACWDASRERWVAHITLNYKLRFLGYYATAQEAHERYLQEKRLIHAGCTI